MSDFLLSAWDEHSCTFSLVRANFWCLPFTHPSFHLGQRVLPLFLGNMLWLELSLFIFWWDSNKQFTNGKEKNFNFGDATENVNINININIITNMIININVNKNISINLPGQPLGLQALKQSGRRGRRRRPPRRGVSIGNCLFSGFLYDKWMILLFFGGTNSWDNNVIVPALHVFALTVTYTFFPGWSFLKSYTWKT